jgi:excisionase family DNA binding protein
MIEIKDLLTTGDAAKLAEATHTSIYDAERRGELVAMRTAGGQRLFYRKDVERYARVRRKRRPTKGALREQHTA